MKISFYFTFVAAILATLFITPWDWITVGEFAIIWFCGYLSGWFDGRDYENERNKPLRHYAISLIDQIIDKEKTKERKV